MAILTGPTTSDNLVDELGNPLTDDLPVGPSTGGFSGKGKIRITRGDEEGDSLTPTISTFRE